MDLPYSKWLRNEAVILNKTPLQALFYKRIFATSHIKLFLLEINFGGMAKYKNPVNALAFKTFLLSRQVI